VTEVSGRGRRVVMRHVVSVSLGLGVTAAVLGFTACSSTTTSGFGTTGAGDSGTAFVPAGDAGTSGQKDSTTTPGFIPPADSGQTVITQNDAGLPPADGSTTVTTKTTIYAHTDTELYSMDPATHAITDIGTFAGMSGGYYDGNITDLAVDAAGDVYVNTEQVIYKATLPATPGAGQKVQLTSFLNTDPTLADGGTLAVKYYALAFAPAGAIGIATIPSGETLVGGDSNGELWAFPATGAPRDIGNFGKDPNVAANFLALSGDLVFYTGAGNQPTGLATIRTCNKASNGKVTCTSTNDYLAGINMANAKANAALTSGTPASLLGGIYGGTATADGNGTGKAEIFGLGAWGNDVYGFARCYHCYDGGTNAPASLLQIDTTSGVATVVGPTFPFTNGWSGAGVTSKVTVTVVAPPPTQNPK